MSTHAHILTQLDDILEQRKSEPADGSYVASLYQKGLEKILKKVAEEATEVVMAAKDCEQQPSAENQQHLINEVADLWFHSLILLAYEGNSSADVMDELQRRFGLSGLIEKANRPLSS